MLQKSVGDKDVLETAVRVLRNGGVIAMPTETVYGLAALWNHPEAQEKIYELKRRPASKRLQMLAASIPDAVQAGLKEDERLHKIAAQFWPGALTVVAAGAKDSIGLRIPNHPFVLALLRALGEPLAATSANLSGRPAGLDARSAVAELAGEPDLLVDGGPVPETGGQASTVVSLLGTEPSLLRQGPVTLEDIRNALKN